MGIVTAAGDAGAAGDAMGDVWFRCRPGAWALGGRGTVALDGMSPVDIVRLNSNSAASSAISESVKAVRGACTERPAVTAKEVCWAYAATSADRCTEHCLLVSRVLEAE